MVSKTKQAIEATRDNSGIVSFSDRTEDRVYATFDGSDIPLECDDLVQDGWLISGHSATNEGVRLFR